ncbi:MAG: integrase arm-type DNA-binding domain-containing protein [Betaproteobacteria bacterium]|nr:integrase arm-type DNA-binding domain-containing protein [Betaproteobacteria bacterium]
MPLTNIVVKNAKIAEKPYKLSDEKGLYLLISKAGRYWRFDYRFEGKRKTLALGVYPDTTLANARDKRDEARKLLANSIDPGEQRKAIKASRQEKITNSFEVVAREWYSKNSLSWSENHGSRIIRRLENDIFPWIGTKPIADIKASELLTVLQRIEKRGAIETAHRALQNCGQVFRYAVATGRAERDPSPDLKGALAPVQQKHRAAITDTRAIGGLLRSIDSYTGFQTTKLALQFAPLVFVRPGELRKAEWVEIDLEKAEWNIPAERMKMREPHLVPLSSQAIKILSELQALNGRSKYVFPSARTPTRPMSDNAILAALRRMGYEKDEMTGHGFRAMARTVLDETLGVRPDFIEHQLAHAVRDPNGRAYNRTAHLAERKKMMQLWADYLDKLKSGADIISFKSMS